MLSASWVLALTVSALSGTIGVVGTLTGSWLTARRDDTRFKHEFEREQLRWDREDERRWFEQRRTIYNEYLKTVHPWMRRVRHWIRPYWDGDSATKESLQNEEEEFDWRTASERCAEIETALTLVATGQVMKAARWLHAQLFAFEATRLVSGVKDISVMGKHCEDAYAWLSWAFRADLGVLTPEPPVKPPEDRSSANDDRGRRSEGSGSSAVDS
jgi:hypothetical protein